MNAILRSRGFRLVVWILLLILVMPICLNYVTPVLAEQYGKKVIIYSSRYDLSVLISLIKSEGFEVVTKSLSEVPLDPSVLEPYDVIIWVSDGLYPYISDAIRSRVINGAGLLIMSYGDPDLVVAGVVLGDECKIDTTSRFVEHPVMEGVRSFYYDGCHLRLVSSDAYPLILGNDETWGFKNPILAVARPYGNGKVVAFGSAYSFIDGYITREDNALLAKNIVYWFAGLEVPEFTPELPNLIELQDTVASLEANVTRLTQQLKELEQNIQEYNLISSFEQLKNEVKSLSDRLNNSIDRLESIFVSNVATLRTETDYLFRQVESIKQTTSILTDQTKQIQFIAFSAIAIAIIALIASLLALRKH